MDEILIRKSAAIERCISRIKEEYIGHEEELHINYTKQDSIILNLQRAIQTTLDMALRYIKLSPINLPDQSKDAYELLYQNSIITEEMMIDLKKTIGFRNIVVHEYQSVDIEIVKSIINKNLPLLQEFKILLLKHEIK